MPVNETVRLDLDEIVKSRFGEKKIPQFVLNWLKRFIHQDHLNGYLEKGYLGVEFAEKSLDYYDVHLTVEGLVEDFSGGQAVLNLGALEPVKALSEKLQINSLLFREEGMCLDADIK